jgi:cell division protein FtsB
MANRVMLLDPQKANPDMVDELVRRDLGLAQPDEVIIPLR